MQLFNTLTRRVEQFEPLKAPSVTLYSCGPTVYDFTHIGQLRTFVNNDLLKRALQYQGLEVKHIMNITDVGHLTGDTDEGEDKLEKGAKKTGKTVWEVARLYTDQFLTSLEAVNILPPDQIPKATDHIPDMITLINKLQEKQFTYETDEAIYFDTARFKKYGALSGQNIQDKIQKAREEVHVDKQKKHPADFALWFKRVGRFATHEMHWESPWGDGFPGWHIECSAMSMKYLDIPIDIHAGGVDLIPVHHENEIAQSEAATDKPFVQVWFHSEFILVDGQKMSKSKENFYTVQDIQKHSLDPIALRYLYMQTHYRKQLNFTFTALQATQTSLYNLYDTVRQLRHQTQRAQLSEEKLRTVQRFSEQFRGFIAKDLQMPQVLALVWEVVKSNIPSEDKLDLLLEFDQVLGLNLAQATEVEIPEAIRALAKKRDAARIQGDYASSDALRKQAEEQGYAFQDSPSGTIIKKTQ